MTKYLENPANTFNRWYGDRLPNGTLINPSDANRLTAPELEALGLFEVNDALVPPDGQILLSGEVKRVSGVVTYVTEYGDRPFEDTQTEKLNAVRQLRKEKEEAGTNVGGIPLQFDDKTQAKITGANSLFDADPSLTHIDWEAQPGVWVTIDQDTMKNLGVAVGRYVQGCFSRARALTEEINAATDIEELNAIDINSGWPT